VHGKAARAWRLRTEGAAISWQDRAAGPQTQDVDDAVGDFVLLRADGCFAYQLAVVVDDANQGISHVVRGADLLDNTARQIRLQQCLQLPTPQYLHTPLVMGANGEKLSKQNGAQAIDTNAPLHALNQAATALGLPAQSGGVDHALAAWTAAWASTRLRSERQTRAT
jgi:glutamyl-Q tRNA(Asp) synthetase